MAEFLGETNLLEGQADGTGLVRPTGPALNTADGVAAGPRPAFNPARGVAAWFAAPEPVNSFPGRIVESVYLGEMARHRFALEAGGDLIVFELNPRPRDGRFFVTVDPADVVPIAES